MDRPKRRVLIATGSSGGHIYPALALGKALTDQDPSWEIYYATGEKPVEQELMRHLPPDKVFPIPGRPLRSRFHALTPQFWSSLIDGLHTSSKLLKSLKTDLTIGFGGYSVFPIVLLSSLKGIPTFIHEQNMELGLANRILSYFTGTVALTFKNETLLKRSPNKFVLTGMPLRSEMVKENRRDALQALGLDEDKHTFLIMGGSLGSHALNSCVADFVSRYGHSLAKKWQFIHLTGSVDLDKIRHVYKKVDLKCKVEAFMERMSTVYSATDFVLSRAGAGAMHECAFYGLAALFVPSPACHNHQLKNVHALSEAGACSVISDDKLNAERLYQQLLAFEVAPERYAQMGHALHHELSTRGSARLVSLAYERARVS